MAWKFSAAATLASVTGLAGATTTLINLPVADILGHREVLFAHTVAGDERDVDERYFHSATLDVGLLDRVEIGGTTDYSGFDTLNFKALLLEREGEVGYALSGGWTEIRDGDSNPFVAGRLDLRRCRLHATWFRDDKDRWMVGADFPVFGDWTGAIEHTGGKDGATWAAVSFDIPQVEGLSLMLSAGLPNSREGSTQHFASVNYGFRF